MFFNHLKTALRILRRAKTYALINIAGLAVGIACCLLLGLYLADELSFDRHHEKADRIYRVTLEEQGEGESVHWARTQPALAPALEREFSEVLQAVRLVSQDATPIHVGEERWWEDALCYVDSAFFEVFSFTIVQGRATERLTAPGTAVLSRSAARRYFGEADVVGRTFVMPAGRDEATVEVAGVVKDMPANSHFHCSAFVSLETLTAAAPPSADFDSRWELIGVYTYALMQSEDEAARLADQLSAFARRHVPERNFRFHFQPLTRIHLHSHLEAELEPNGHITYVYVFGTVALLILLIACINFINLATARATRRAKEVGIRKAVGAFRGQLVRQFLTESMLFVVLASLLGVLVWHSLPLFNELSDKALAIHEVAPVLGAFLLGIVLPVGLLAGSYPAFMLSAFRPAAALKGKAHNASAGGTALRKGLVVLQFTISVVLIASTLVIYNQLSYVKGKPLGFEKEHVVVVPNLRSVSQDLETVKQELLRHERIRNVAAARYAPTRVSPNYNPVQAEGQSKETTALLHPVDADYLEALDLSVVEGRSFNRAAASDSSAVLINEAAARRFGWTDPIDKEIRLPDERTRRVIGVVEDFHFQSLHETIEPSVFYLPDAPRAFRELIVRFSPGEAAGVLAFLEEKWTSFAPEEPFDYLFLDESYRALYQTEERIGQLIGVFAGIAILIACFGLFGLTAFTAERRTKEIGIRKALGASVPSIIALLSKDFLKLVFLAFVVAAPIAYYVTSRWLESFAYRIDLSPWLFLGAGALALAVALLTVSYQAMKAALTDPVEAIRYE